jgi:hypothetical protein
MAGAQRIAKLAANQGWSRVDELWALVNYSLNGQVRMFVYPQATHPNS